MTQEQAIYKSSMACSGDRFDERWQKVEEGETVHGMVWMCTHPSLVRLNVQDGGYFVSVVKASVKVDESDEEMQNGDGSECDEYQDEKELMELFTGVVG